MLHCYNIVLHVTFALKQACHAAVMCTPVLRVALLSGCLKILTHMRCGYISVAVCTNCSHWACRLIVSGGSN